MNSNVKKIIYIFTPIIVVLISLAILFGTLGTINSKKYNQILDNKYVAYTEKSLNSTITSDGYKTNATVTLINKGTTALKNFMVSVTFVDEEGNTHTYEVEDKQSFTSKTMDILVDTVYDKKIVEIKDVNVKIDDVYSSIYTNLEYLEIYGDKPEFVSITTVEAFKVLTIACTLLSVIGLVTGGCLVALFYEKKKSTKVKKQYN